MMNMDTVWLLEALTPLFEKGEPQTSHSLFFHGILLFLMKKGPCHSRVFDEKKDFCKFDALVFQKGGSQLPSNIHSPY